jgi:hypothetical protein
MAWFFTWFFAWGLGLRRRPFGDDFDLLDDLAGLGADLLAQLVRVELAADDHPVVLVFILDLLDAVVL